MAFFYFFQDGSRPPPWIYGAHFGTTHEESLEVFIVGQILVGINSVVFNMEVWIFHVFGCKCLFKPQNCFLAIWLPKWEIVSMRPPKAHPCVETRRMTYRSWKSVHLYDLCTWLTNQKRQRTRTVANWLFAQTTYEVGSRYSFVWLVFFRW